MSEKQSFVIIDGKAHDRSVPGQGRFFPADLLGRNTNEIERAMQLRYADETRDELPELLGRVRRGIDDRLLQLVLLFGDDAGVRSAVLEGLDVINAVAGDISSFAQAISALKLREAAPVLRSRLRALPLDDAGSRFHAGVIASHLLAVDDTDEVAAAVLAGQLGSSITGERVLAAFHARDCDHEGAMTPALNTLRTAVARLVDDDDDVFVAAAPMLLIVAAERARERTLKLLSERALKI